MSANESKTAAKSGTRVGFRYSLRTMLIVTTACCVVTTVWLNALIRQRTAVRRFYELTSNRNSDAVTMGYRYRGKDSYYKPIAYKWLHPLIGEEAFGEATAVQLLDTPTTDEDLRFLADVPTVERLILNNTKVTNDGLRHLLACPRLRSLQLDGLPVADEGLAGIVALTDLEEISLNGTNITDVGMGHLAKLPNLKRLWLRDTAITEAGCQLLEAALPGCEIQSHIHDSRPVRPEAFQLDVPSPHGGI